MSEPGAPSLAPIFGLYAGRRAHRRYAEAVTQLEHGLQCAQLAIDAGAPDALIAASLLHDVGHLIEPAVRDGADRPGADLRHEELAWRFLRRWFGADVTAPIVLHVAAKRYLCAVDDSYGAVLSPASVRSLELQGGPMGAAERETFERRPGWEAAIRLRRWDDSAKTPGLDVTPFEEHRSLLERLARA